MCRPARPITLSPRSRAVMSGPAEVFGTSRRRRMRPRKNKRTNKTKQNKKTSLQRKGKKQSKQLSYIIPPPPTLDSGPHAAPLRHQGPQTALRMWQPLGLCTTVWAFVVVPSPAAAGQNICWTQSGQVRERRHLRQTWAPSHVLHCQLGAASTSRLITKRQPA